MSIESLIENSVALTQFLQTTFPNLLALMRGINAFTEPEVCFLLFIAIYSGINRDKGSSFIYLLGLVLVIFSILQHLIQFPAPFWLDKGIMQAETGSFAAPNLNIAIALLLVLPFKRFVRTDLVLFVFLFVAILAGLSQLYLGIASIIDLLFGFASGVTIILIWVRWNKRYGKSFSQRILGQRFWIAIFFPLSLGVGYLILSSWAQRIGLSDSYIGQVDQNLYSRAVQTGFINTFDSLAILAGIGVGISFESARVGFRPAANMGSSLINWLIGFFLLGGLLYLLKSVSTTSAYFQSGEPLPIAILAIKSLTTMVVCTYVAPWLFTVVGTATSEAATVPTISMNNFQLKDRKVVS